MEPRTEPRLVAKSELTSWADGPLRVQYADSVRLGARSFRTHTTCISSSSTRRGSSAASRYRWNHDLINICQRRVCARLNERRQGQGVDLC